MNAPIKVKFFVILVEVKFNKNKIKVIRLGVDLKTFYPKKIKKKEKKFTIISSGEISIRKGSHLLIEAFNNLKLPNTELLFVGKLEKGINSFLDGIKNPNIFFMGKKNELELNKENESTFMDHLKNAGFNTEDTENINIMKKFVTMKNTVGTFIWIILFSIITILTSQNTLLNQSCSKKIVDQKGFSDYVNSQLEESTSNT